MQKKYYFQYLTFLIIVKIVKVFGFGSFKYSSKVLAFFVFNILRIRRNVVLSNLSGAFPKLTTKELKSLAFKNYQSTAITFLEIFTSNKSSKEDIKNKLTIENIELIFERYREGKGLILLTAHFGNWELAALGTGIWLDENIRVLVKKQKNTYVAEWLTGMRERFGNTEITLGVSVRELYKTIKNKNIVGIVGDQRGRRDGVQVKFFNKLTYTFPGTAAIALKTKCPVLVLLAARQPDGTYKGEIKEIKFSSYEGDLSTKIASFNQEYMSILEGMVKEYPEQWLWMHNIWKY